ncbi:MAG: hypothetical protein AMJ54_11155 [Deltaproteobacteria bacterium SG8_13]|nr:MAG: hypothetical protein AMJ54_11155 [Deltaproteobacteria bacterium SG8_13]
MLPRPIPVVYLAFFCLLAGCATTPRSSADAKRQEVIENTSSVMVIVLQSDVYRLTSGGVTEKVDEWCEQAERNLRDAAVSLLSGKPMLVVKTYPESMMSAADRVNLNDTRALAGAVVASIRLHVSGAVAQQFYDKIENFDYSLGAEVKSLARGADALLFISSIDVNPTAARQAVQAGMLLVTLPTILFGGIPVVLPGEFNVSSAMLVEAESGAVLWHKFYLSRDAHDLTTPLKTTEFMETLLRQLPI